MRRLFAMILGVLIGGGGFYGAHQYHVVRSHDNFLFVRKQRPAFDDAYVDIRKWTPRDWNEHRQLAQNMTASGHGQIVNRGGGGGIFRKFLGSFGENFNRSPSSNQRRD